MKHIHPYLPRIEELFEAYTINTVVFLRSNIKELVTTVDGNLVFALLKLFECLLEPFVIKEGKYCRRSGFPRETRFVLISRTQRVLNGN